MAENNPVISIDLGLNGGNTNFYSLADIERWVQRERDYWEWLSKCRQLDQDSQQIWKQQAEPWLTISNKVAILQKNPHAENFQTILGDIGNAIREHYGSFHSLHSTTPAAKLIEEHKDDPLTAIYILNYFIKSPFTFNFGHKPQFFHKYTASIIEAMLFERNISESAESERKALDDLRKQYYETLATLQQKLADAEKAVNRSRIDFDEMYKSHENKFLSITKDSESKLQEITDIYDKRLQLQASESYWGKKATKHRNISLLFACGFLASLLLFGNIMFREIEYLLGSLRVDQKPEYWIIALIALSALIGIWIVRVIVRVMLSHIHLHQDASERVTMLTTYLALHREGKGLNENDKQLILQALFRPGMTGIIKDDGIPSSAWEWITRTGGPK